MLWWRGGKCMVAMMGEKLTMDTIIMDIIMDTIIAGIIIMTQLCGEGSV